MSRNSLLLAVQAIEQADEDENVSALRHYVVEECGVDEEVLQRMIDMPGGTDAGRLSVNVPVEEDEDEQTSESGAGVDSESDQSGHGETEGGTESDPTADVS